MNKNKADAQKKDRKRKLKIEEISQVKEKKRAIEAAIQSLETDINKYSFAAEKILLTKADSFFFLSGFSLTDTDNSQDSRGREGTFFIPLYHFHLLTNIQTFMCNFAREMTITYF